MSNVRALKEFSTLKTGPFGTQFKASEYVPEGIPVINVKNIGYGDIVKDNLDYISERTRDRLSEHVLQRGDIVFGRKGSVDRHCLISEVEEGWFQGSDCLRVRITDPAVDPQYVSYYLLSSHVLKSINNAAVGSTMASINMDIIGDIKIVLPSYETQRKIAAVLKKLDDKRAINTAVNDNLQQMAKSIYDYWFLQFEFPDNDGKPYRSSGGAMVWNAQLKCKIPAGWDVTTLKGLFEIERGISYSSKDIEKREGIPMINLASVDTHRNYKPEELKYYSGKIVDKAKLQAYDLLVACTDLTRNADIVGCPILVPDDHKTYVFSMDMAKITSTTKNLDEMYLYMTLRTDFYHAYIKRWASGTNVLHLNLDGLDWYPIGLPPIELQQKFGAMVRDVHRQTCILMDENERLTNLRNWLLPNLLP